ARSGGMCVRSLGWLAGGRSPDRVPLPGGGEGLARDDPLRLPDELGEVDPLPDEAARPARGRLAPRRVVELAAEHEDGNRSRAVALLDPPQHLPAVDVRHHHVEEDELGLASLDRGEAFVRARGLLHVVALPLELYPDEFPHPFVIVDEKDARACLLTARTGASGERFEVAPAETPVASRRVEGRHTALIRPLANRALGDAE